MVTVVEYAVEQTVIGFTALKNGLRTGGEV